MKRILIPGIVALASSASAHEGHMRDMSFGSVYAARLFAPPSATGQAMPQASHGTWRNKP
jgi:hypothetical protein